jgi:hypothetical protein
LSSSAPQARVNLDTADWCRLSASTFENLCADMLRSFGFQNVQLLGGPGDKGRDIVCERMLRFGPGIATSLSWIVQCKHTVQGLTKHAVYKDLVKAKEHRADFWWLLTTANITPALYDWFRAIERTEFPFRMDCLDRGTLSSAVLGLPRLLGKYFPFGLGPKEQVWVKVMSVMSNGHYQQALEALRTNDDGVHPRISYLIACCLSMLARDGGYYDQLVEEAFQALEEAHVRGYISYMEDLFGWPENKCRSQVRLDPELSLLLKYDRERFLVLFGPDTSAGDSEHCLSPGTMVRLERGAEQPIGSLKPGSRLVTQMAPDPEYGEVAAVRNQQVLGTFLINSEVRTSARHRFATIDGWRCAEELRIGDMLTTFDGWRAVSSVTFEPGPARVCQMVVLGRPCFYANGYLVHNDK